LINDLLQVVKAIVDHDKQLIIVDVIENGTPRSLMVHIRKATEGAAEWDDSPKS
jgi:hypothetical protein